MSQTNVMRPLTERMLAEALEVLAGWMTQGRLPTVSVNIGAPNLLDLGSPDVVARLLDETAVTPGLLRLEVTEDAVITDTERAQGVLSALRTSGWDCRWTTSGRDIHSSPG